MDALSEVLAEQIADGVAVVFSSHQLELVERLCDSVAIIHAGRLVASGPVDALCHDGKRPALRVEVEGSGGPAWVDGLVGVEMLTHEADAAIVRLADGVDDQGRPGRGTPQARSATSQSARR